MPDLPNWAWLAIALCGGGSLLAILHTFAAFLRDEHEVMSLREGVRALHAEYAKRLEERRARAQQDAAEFDDVGQVDIIEVDPVEESHQPEPRARAA